MPSDSCLSSCVSPAGGIFCSFVSGRVEFYVEIGNTDGKVGRLFELPILFIISISLLFFFAYVNFAHVIKCF